MTLDVSSLPTPVSIRWIKEGPNFTYTDAGFHDQASANPTEAGNYIGVAWANDPALPPFRTALAWEDRTGSFRHRAGGTTNFNSDRYVNGPTSGYRGVFERFTVPTQ